eukprot:EC835282.1.p4 GENE.EC835282.1~~EC835282.1.p4  ORF type:complete len:89 (-),score=13.25 EC835282.1:147-413(-)
METHQQQQRQQQGQQQQQQQRQQQVQVPGPGQGQGHEQQAQGQVMAWVQPEQKDSQWGRAGVVPKVPQTDWKETWTAPSWRLGGDRHR